MMQKKRITHDELIKSGLVPWNSKRTTYRKIAKEGFPGYFDGMWYFDPKEVEVYFKQHKKIA